MERVSDQYLRLFIDQAPVSIAMFDREHAVSRSQRLLVEATLDFRSENYRSIAL